VSRPAPVVINFECKFCLARYAVAVAPVDVRAVALDWAARHMPCRAGRDARFDCSGFNVKDEPTRTVFSAVFLPKERP